VRCGMTEGLAEERRRNGIIRAEPLFHFQIFKISLVVSKRKKKGV